MSERTSLYGYICCSRYVQLQSGPVITLSYFKYGTAGENGRRYRKVHHWSRLSQFWRRVVWHCCSFCGHLRIRSAAFVQRLYGYWEVDMMRRLLKSTQWRSIGYTAVSRTVNQGARLDQISFMPCCLQIWNQLYLQYQPVVGIGLHKKQRAHGSTDENTKIYTSTEEQVQWASIDKAIRTARGITLFMRGHASILLASESAIVRIVATFDVSHDQMRSKRWRRYLSSA